MNSAKRGRASDQHVGDDLARRGVDEMRHVGGLGGTDQDLAVRADRHAFRLDADLDVAHADPLFEVDDGYRVVVLVGDIEDFTGGILGEELRIGTGGQAVHHLLGRGIDHLDLVVIANRDQHEFAVPREFDTARALADPDGPGDRPLVGVDHRYRVAFLIRYIRDEGQSGCRGREPHSHSGKQTPTPHPPSFRHQFSLRNGLCCHEFAIPESRGAISGHAVLDCQPYQLGRCTHAELLAHDRGGVGDRLVGGTDQPRDFGQAFAGAEQAQYLHLTRSQL